MTTKRPWMPFYVRDYRADTAHLTLEQHGAYLLLISEYWHRGGLPTDESQISRILGISLEKWENTIRIALVPLFVSGWKHKRIDLELAKCERIRVRNKKNIAKRWENKKKLDSTSGKRHVSATYTTLHNIGKSLSNLDPTEIPKKIPKRETRKSKKQSFLHELPEDWEPDSGDLAYKIEHAISDRQFQCSLESMRLWAKANGIRKKDWHATLKGFMHRDVTQHKPNGTAGRSNGSYAATKAFLEGDDLYGDHTERREEGSGKVIPMLPGEWRRE